MSHDRGRTTGRSRRQNIRRLIRVMVAVDVVIVMLIAALWVFKGDELRRGDQLRGSLPPSGQRAPAFSKFAGVTPGMPTRSQLRGHATLVAVTCIECRSGDIFGGFLRLLAERRLDDDTELHVLVWGGDPERWRSSWNIPRDVHVHEVTGRSAILAVKSTMHVDDSGIAYLYDARGIWRSTFHAGQLNADDVAHDLRALD